MKCVVLYINKNYSNVNKFRSVVIHISYISIFSGRFKELNFDANFLIDAIELRSNSIASTLASGTCLTISCLTSFPVQRFLTAIMTWTPRNARTLDVSAPIPLEAPTIVMILASYSMKYSKKWSTIDCRIFLSLNKLY